MIRTLIYRVTLAGAIALALAGFIQRQAGAATLHRLVEVDTDVVTLGDLFADAGDLAGRPVFRSPDVGITGALPVAQALAAADGAGLAVDARPDFANVTVTRRATIVDAAAFTRLIAAAAAARLGVAAADVAVSYDGDVAAMSADAAAADPVVLSTLTLQSGSGRFEASLSVDVGAADQSITLRGRAYETVAVPVLNHPLARRDLIGAEDVVTARFERRYVPSIAVLDAGDLIGKAARRPLRAGEIVAVNDVEEPRLVERGQLVTLVLRRPGLALSARGRVLADGARGEIVNVLNEQSHRTVQGVVASAGVVEVGAPTAPANVVAAAN